MPAIGSRFCAIGVCAALVTGCGGGSTSGGGGGGGGGNNPTTVTFTFTGATPTAVATQIGAGSFRAVTAPSDTVTLSVPNGTTDFAVAYLCPPYTVSGNTTQRQFVFEATLTDGTAFEPSCSAPFPNSSQTGTLSGTVNGSSILGSEMVWLEAGTATNWVGQGISGSAVSLSIQPPVGSDDAVALASTDSGGDITILAVKDLGEQTVPGVLNSGNPIMLSATDETTQQPITYQNSPSGYAPGTEVSFVTEEGGSIFLQSSTNSSYPAVPAAMLQGNAYYESVSIAGDVDATWVSFTRNWNSGGGPLTVIFPSVWTYSGPAAAALPVFNFSTYTGFTGTTGIARVVRETWGTGANTGSSYQVTASANFQDGAETVATPDLSGLSGFLAVPLSGTTVSWVAYINQNSAGAIAATPEDTPTNSSTETVQDAGRFVVP